MYRVSRAEGNGATNDGGKSVAKSSPTPTDKASCDTFGKTDADWFSDMVRTLHGDEAPKAIWCDTGIAFDIRDCQRYVTGEVKPKAYFLRALLRSPNGWTYLAYLMDGSDAPWWTEVQYGKKVAGALKHI